MRTLKSVANAVAVLKAFGDNPEWGVTQLAGELGLPKSVTHRLLQTLTLEGFLSQDAHRGTYNLGIEVAKLAYAAERNNVLTKLAHPYLEELSRISGETVTLAILRGQRGLCVDSVDGDHAIRYSVQLGDTIQLHSGAIGKALLAFQPAAFIADILSGPLPKFTDNTIVDPARLRVALDEIRQAGWAYSESEITPGSRSVAAPIHNVNGAVVASIALTSPTMRMPDELVKHYHELVVNTTAELSSRMGYDPIIHRGRKPNHQAMTGAK